MNILETYFKWKFASEFLFPLLFVLAFILVSVYFAIKNKRKARLMNKLGYTYNRMGGTNVSYQFQPHWVKGDIKIHYRRIENLDYSKIESYVNVYEKSSKEIRR